MKSQTFTAEQFAAPAAPKPAGTALMMLDENSARLNMAGERPAGDTDIIFEPAVPSRKDSSLVKEAVALVVLTLLFTGAIWLTLWYIGWR